MCTTHVISEPVEINVSQILELPAVSLSGGYSDVKWTKLMTHDPPTLIAIKCFRQRPDLKPTQITESIDEEIRVWKILNGCPNVVALFGVILDLGKYSSNYIPPYPVSEYCEQGPLSSFLYRHTPSDLQRLELLTGIIQGIMHIHSKSVVHGDMKASNIVISDTTEGYIPKICDFGSSHSNCDDCYGGSKVKTGTLQWNSPEFYEDEDEDEDEEGEPRPGTAKSDVWAFGCVALEVQFGKIPYDVNDLRAMSMIISGKPPATEKSLGRVLETDGVATAVWEVMQRCWQQDPAERPDSQDVMDQLNLVLAREGGAS